MPVEDSTIDVIISNCVINLAPDKRKVFREMFRVAKQGGRFTISDIVADQPVPQYLVHDAKKWGDCLSGALTLSDYIAGMMEAGFLGIHLATYAPWQVIDGFHFFSVTLTGYKLQPASSQATARFATLRGPFSRAVDELGTAYLRGIPQPITTRIAALLSQPSLAEFFILSPDPQWLDRSDPRWFAVLPAQTPCVWQGHFAFFAGPFVEVADDDHHVYRRGEPLEICSKTRCVLESEPYAAHFAFLNRAGQTADAEPVSCKPNGGCC
jgi:arsenite methyltransferase